MNRKEKIFQAVCELCITFPNGLTTEQIALYTNIARPNVSNYLNQFIKENKIVKSGTRPVLYSIKKETLKPFIRVLICLCLMYKKSLSSIFWGITEVLKNKSIRLKLLLCILRMDCIRC